MFDFQKLIVYQRSIEFYTKISKEIFKKNLIDKIPKDQLKRASMSITLNIAEGTSRFSKADRRHFYTIARGSLYECIAVLDLLKEDALIDEALRLNLSSTGEEISKMLYAMEVQLTKQCQLQFQR